MSRAAGFSETEIAEADAKALAMARARRAVPARGHARPQWGVNHVLAYGQSLSSGWEGWPALSTRPLTDALMLGESVRPRREDAPEWQPVGEAAFRPLAAVNQRNSAATGHADGLLGDAEAAALTPGDVTLGESVLEAAVHFFRQSQLHAAGMAADPARRILASSCGVGGRSLAELSPGATPELFHRLRACTALARQLAGVEGYGVLALLLLQGEQDYHLRTPRAAYRAGLEALRQAVLEQLAPEQPPPAIFTYQTGGIYADDAHELAVGMAQLDCALGRPGWFMAAPAYPVTNRKGGHLDADGHRWLGLQFGKVMHRVITLGESWRPLHPYSVARRGADLLVICHVPAPPLVFDAPFQGRRRAALDQHGFRVSDALGDIALDSVTLAGQAVVRLRLSRLPEGRVLCWHADKTRHNGLGGLRDSDATVAPYAFAGGDGGAPEAGSAQAELAGRPYRLHNWCVAFALEAQSA